MSTATQLSGDLAKAMDHARRAISIHEPLAAAQPASTTRQRELLNSYERLSYVAGNPDLVNLGDLAMALTYNRKVLAMAEALEGADPNNRMAATDLVVAKRFACTFAADDDAGAVIRTCQESLDAAAQRGRAAIEVQPTAALRLGPALTRAKRRSEAVKTMESTIQLLTDTVREWPWRTDIQLHLVRVHNQYGRMLADMGDVRGALVHLESAVGIAERLQQTRPQDMVVQRDIADCYTSLGVYYEHRNPAKAREWYAKDLDIWSRWRLASSMSRQRREQAIRNVARCARG
jgi:tetratricopeptide (TPR) repeat protein